MCVHISRGLTQSVALILCSFSFDGLLDDILSGAMEATLPTFDPVHQLNLLEFRVKSVEVPEDTHRRKHTSSLNQLFET